MKLYKLEAFRLLVAHCLGSLTFWNFNPVAAVGTQSIRRRLRRLDASSKSESSRLHTKVPWTAAMSDHVSAARSSLTRPSSGVPSNIKLSMDER